MKPADFKQLFVVEDALIEGLDAEEVRLTWEDMVELNLYAPPFPNFDVRVTAHAFAVLSSAAVQLTKRQICKSEVALEKIRAQLREDEGRDVSDEEIASRLDQMQEACEDIDPAHYRFPVRTTR